ncbi:MAG: preprotein translocase subunit SecG [Bowdeniella nasicola]|nr:preprotein translocase subunit SecG [Bowdeniella nasicola]
MTALRIILEILLVITSLFLILTILMHKGRGGGMSDMFGGGLSSSFHSSGVAERNLNRITIGVAIVWTVTIFVIGLLTHYAPAG